MRFISRYKRYTLQVEPSYVVVEAGHAREVRGKVIRFEDYRYETADEAEIAYLKRHDCYGVDFWEEKGPTELPKVLLTPEERANKAECPICGRYFTRGAAIIQHMKSCLRAQDAPQDTATKEE